MCTKFFFFSSTSLPAKVALMLIENPINSLLPVLPTLTTLTRVGSRMAQVYGEFERMGKNKTETGKVGFGVYQGK